MAPRPRADLDREALSDRKASRIPAKESENQLNAEEPVNAGSEDKQQIRKTARKDEPLYFAHV